MRLNLIIDASGIFYRSFFTVGNYGVKKGQKLLSSQESKGVFMRKLATDFSALVRSVDNVSRVIVCLDSTSWRKKIDIQEGSYKHSREKGENDNVDWDSFFTLTQEFTDILFNRGYIISKVYDAEADDLLFLWSRKLNDLGESVIMITGDRDLLQVVNLHSNGAWTVALDPVNQRRKVCITENMQSLSCRQSDTDVNIFDSNTWGSSSADVLTTLLESNDVKVIDPESIITTKVLYGDPGDCVPGIIDWKDKKDETKIRYLSENKIVKVLDSIPKIKWNELEDNLDVLHVALSEISKLSLDKEKLLDRIKRNIKLVVLNESIIPEEIQRNFDKVFDELACSPIHLTRESILEGTKWWTESKGFVPKNYDFKVEEEPDIDLFENNKEIENSDQLLLNKAINDIKNKTKGPVSLF